MVDFSHSKLETLLTSFIQTEKYSIKPFKYLCTNQDKSEERRGERGNDEC